MLSVKVSSLMRGAWKTIELRINAEDKSTSNKKDIAEACGNKFLIPLDFEMLDSSAPYYQARLGNRLCYEITLNDYNQVSKSAKAPDAKYVISNISLEYKIVSNSTLDQGSEFKNKLFNDPKMNGFHVPFTTDR